MSISFTVAVVTLSDKSSAGKRADLSGPTAVKILKDGGYNVVETLILSDDKELIERELIRLADKQQVNLVITTGGTGFFERDVTPEATLAIAHKNVPGIAERIRSKSCEKTEYAMLSRGVSVIRNKTLIINLPGSPKAVDEVLGFILPVLKHGLEVLGGYAYECG